MGPKKTVCIVMGGHFSATIGGAQYQAKCVVEGLKESGQYNIFYLTRVFDPDYQPDGYQIVKIADPTGIRKHGLAFDTRRLLNLLNELEPDVIYQRGLKSYTGVIAYYAMRAKSRSIFHIAHDHNLLPLEKKAGSRLHWLRRLEKRMGEYGLRRVDRVIAQTHYQADLLFKNYTRKADAVVPNFHPYPVESIIKEKLEIRVVWVANFKTMKRPELFVQLASKLSNRTNMRFIMIGRPGSITKYKQLHDEILRLDNLTYMGEQPIEEVNRQLARAHIFVSTSRMEGFPNTFIQAWMRKVPTVSLDVDPDKVIATYGLGYCTESFEELCDMVVALSKNDYLREKMGERAQHYAFSVHSPNGVQRILEMMDG